jgi:hypothetical protein
MSTTSARNRAAMIGPTPVSGSTPLTAEFLRERREELQERLRQMQAALTVLDGKIAHYSALADDPKG